MKSDVAVIATELYKSFKMPDNSQLCAINNVSMIVKKGELTALVGSDGAGKTTLLRMMTGLIKPDAGQLSVLGIDVSQRPQEVQDRISYMPQRFGLYEDLSVRENMELYADLHGVPQNTRHKRFARMLAMTDMTDFTERPTGKLSGGMKQKLGLICTLVRSPDLLLLDEPSVGVDPLSRRELWQIIQKLVDEEKLSVIVSTAYMDEAERCGQVFVMHQGHLPAEGTPNALRQYAAGLSYIAMPPAGKSVRNLQTRLFDAADLIVDAVPKGGAVHFIRRPTIEPQALAQLLDGIEYRLRKEELEDAFMLLHRQRSENADTGEQSAASKSTPLHTDKHTDTATTAPSPITANPPDSPSPITANPTTDTAATGSTGNIGEEKPIIIVRDLTRKFGDFTAVSATSFAIGRGEIFGLLGPNGAGKTTTFRMLCGLLPATSGHLEVAGTNLRTARAQARSHIGYVSQKFALYGNLTVRENLAFFGGAYGLSGRILRNRIAAVTSRFDLNPTAISGMLPTGYKQRLAMAAALLHEPNILFLDEPTSGIDPLARRAFWRNISELSRTGVTVIVTTHFMEEAEYCDRIAIQDAGKVLALGTPQAVRKQAGHGDDADMNEVFIAIVEHNRRMSQNKKEGGEV